MPSGFAAGLAAGDDLKKSRDKGSFSLLLLLLLGKEKETLGLGDWKQGFENKTNKT